MKKIISIMLIMLLSLGALAACGQSGGADGEEAIKGSVVVAGSTSVQPVSEELAMAFMDTYSGISIEIQGGGSGQGIKSIQEKIADFGALSRNVKEEEKTAVVREDVIALDGVAVIVNPESTVEDLTIEQIKKIYTGEIKNWKEVGGADAPIVVVSREEGSGTRGAFTEITKVLSKNEAGAEIDGTTKDALIQGSTGAIMQTVASTPNTIGYVSLGSLGDRVKAVKVEGVEPRMETVLDGSYKISRPFIYVSGGGLSEAARLFMEFILSSEGQAIVEESGFIPVN